jgi:hypothetical protein
MTNGTDHSDQGRTTPLEYIARLIDFIKVIFGAIVTVIVVVFICGIIWGRIVSYENKVDRQKEEIDSLKSEIATFKANLGNLGNTYYDIDTPGTCSNGNVVVGLIQEEKKPQQIRCASVARAVWNQSTCQGTCPKK